MKTEQRRDQQGRFIRICQGGWSERAGQYVECNARARYYIAGYGALGLYGSSGSARFCKRHAKSALRRMAGTGRGWERNTYRIEAAVERSR